MDVKHYLIIFLVFFITLLSRLGGAGKSPSIIPNHPLLLIQYIYGTNAAGKRDTPESGGTLVSLAQNSAGHLYLLYTGNRSEIQVVDPNGALLFRFGGQGEEEWQFSSYTCGMAISSKGEALVADVKRHRILVFDEKGNFRRSFSSIQGLTTHDPKQDPFPSHIAVGTTDRVYISDGRNGHVWIHAPGGEFLRSLGGPEPGRFPSAGQLCFDSRGRIYILEGIPNRIQVCAPEGNPLMQIGETGSRAGEFLRISGLAIDSRDRVYATDIVQCVVQIFGSEGDLVGVVKEYTTPEGESLGFVSPSGIVIGRGDIIYVIEQPLHRVVVLKHPSESDRAVERKGN
ncbi:MAG: NHL repeat-containing protein [bacterium]